MEPTNESGYDETEKCPFCYSLSTPEHWPRNKHFGVNVVRFSEHYYFCTDCSAIYTYPIICEKHCNHIKSHSPLAEHLPSWKEARETVAYIDEIGDKQTCNKCNKPVIADGW